MKKKLPKREGSVEWDLIPLYIEWVAKNKDGTVRCFFKKPRIIGYGWGISTCRFTGDGQPLHPTDYDLSGISWRKSLRRRPEDPFKLENVFKL